MIRLIKDTIEAARLLFADEPLVGPTGVVRWHEGNLELEVQRAVIAPDGNKTWERVWVPESQKKAAAPREKDGG